MGRGRKKLASSPLCRRGTVLFTDLTPEGGHLHSEEGACCAGAMYLVA